MTNVESMTNNEIRMIPNERLAGIPERQILGIFRNPRDLSRENSFHSRFVSKKVFRYSDFVILSSFVVGDLSFWFRRDAKVG